MSNMNCPSASFTLLAISGVASRNTNEPTACIPPQLRLYLPHFAAVAVSFVAVAVPLDKCRCIRSGSGAVPAVAGQMELCVCNGLTVCIALIN